MPDIRYSSFRPELILSIGPLILTFGVAAALAVWSAGRLRRHRAGHRLWPLGTLGTSELEFALALPIFLVSVLTTVQVALMVNAHLIVDYAAFCAARSAAVWIPQEAGGEARFIVAADGTRDSEKQARIHRAAAIAVLPISPRATRFRFGLSVPRAPQDIDPAALAQLASAADAGLAANLSPARLALIAADKWPYAYWYTDVALENGAGSVATNFEGQTTVTARVTHRFEMAVPFAGAFLGSALGDRYVPLVGHYVPIAAAYTLMMAAAS